MITKKQKGISLNEELYNKVKKITKIHPKDFDTPTEFIRKAIEEKLEDYEKTIEILDLKFGPNVTEKKVYDMLITLLSDLDDSTPDPRVKDLLHVFLWYQYLVDPEYDDVEISNIEMKAQNVLIKHGYESPTVYTKKLEDKKGQK